MPKQYLMSIPKKSGSEESYTFHFPKAREPFFGVRVRRGNDESALKAYLVYNSRFAKRVGSVEVYSGPLGQKIPKPNVKVVAIMGCQET